MFLFFWNLSRTNCLSFESPSTFASLYTRLKEYAFFSKSSSPSSMPCSIPSMCSDITCTGCRLFDFRLCGFFVLWDDIGVHDSIFCVSSFKISASSNTLLRGAIGGKTRVVHVEPSGDMVSRSCSCLRATDPLPPTHPCIYQSLNGGSEVRCLIVPG